MISSYNNIAIASLAISAVLQNAKEIPISKLYLILPIVFHRRLLNSFAKKNCKVYGVEYIIVTQFESFINFSDRFDAYFALTTDVLQLFLESNIIQLTEDRKCVNIKSIPYTKEMGDRASKLYSAAENIADFLTKESSENLYLNLRIKI